MTPGEAVGIVAAHLVAEMVSDEIGYPPMVVMRAADWDAVSDHMRAIAPELEQDRVDAAYALLAERAEQVS